MYSKIADKDINPSIHILIIINLALQNSYLVLGTGNWSNCVEDDHEFSAWLSKMIRKIYVYIYSMLSDNQPASQIQP